MCNLKIENCFCLINLFNLLLLCVFHYSVFFFRGMMSQLTSAGNHSHFARLFLKQLVQVDRCTSSTYIMDLNLQSNFIMVNV